MAERQGFEPWVPFWGTLTFQASTFDHSVTSPKELFVAGGGRGTRTHKGFDTRRISNPVPYQLD